MIFPLFLSIIKKKFMRVYVISIFFFPRLDWLPREGEAAKKWRGVGR